MFQFYHHIAPLKTPKRIISLVPSQTELLVDLGLEEHIVGITKFCIHPSSLKNEKKIVGGTKNIKLESISALRPDVILCNKEENTKEIVAACAKIAPTHVSNITTTGDVLKLINAYGEIFSCKEKAIQLRDTLCFALKNFSENLKNTKRLNTAYFIWKNPWMVAGNNTFINSMLELNYFENSFKSQERYPEIDLQKLETKNIDLILLSSEPYPFEEKHKSELQKYAPSTKIIMVDGEMFSWYGSRLLKAFDYFERLHKSI